MGECAILLLVITIVLLASPECDHNRHSEEKKSCVNAFKRNLRTLQRCSALPGHRGEPVGSIRFPPHLHSQRSSRGFRSGISTSAAARWHAISTGDSGRGSRSPTNTDHVRGGCFPALSAGDRDGRLVPGLLSSVLLTHVMGKC